MAQQRESMHGTGSRPHPTSVYELAAKEDSGHGIPD